MSFVPFDYVKNSIELTTLLDRCGWTATNQFKGSLRGRCPICGAESHRKQPFCVDKEQQVFFCHKCKSMGDVIDFYAAYLAVELQEAAAILASDFNLKCPTYAEWRKGSW